MRSTKELLILLQRSLFKFMWFKGCYGLCACIYELRKKGRISLQEQDSLKDHLYAHKPHQRYWESYWWRPGAFWPRYLFLTKLIGEIKEG